jgi:hypothetical protein
MLVLTEMIDPSSASTDDTGKDADIDIFNNNAVNDKK